MNLIHYFNASRTFALDLEKNFSCTCNFLLTGTARTDILFYVDCRSTCKRHWPSSSAGLEYLTTNQRVGGSNPSWVTILKKQTATTSVAAVFFVLRTKMLSKKGPFPEGAVSRMADWGESLARTDKENAVSSAGAIRFHTRGRYGIPYCFYMQGTPTTASRSPSL